MTSDTVGGVWTYALDLSAGLAERGVEVVLAAMGPELRPQQREAARELANVRLEFRPYALEWMTDPWRDVDASDAWLLGLAREHRASLIHANTYCHGSLAFDAPTVVVGHSCVYSWYQAVRGVAPPASFEEYRRRVRHGLRGADVVVAPSRAMMAALHEHYGPLPRCRVIENGRQLDRFEPRKKQPMVFSSGRLWDDAKNVETLDRAAQRLPWPICVAGDTRAPQGEDRTLRALTCLGVLHESELSVLLGRASIYAAPARYEPFGLAILEAAASECALVLGDIPSLREVWGDAATFVAPNDVEALTHALGDLMRHPRKCRERGLLARQRALALGHRRMARAYLDLYAELLEGASDASSEFPSPAEIRS
jgi:glycogen synthase